MAEQVEQKEAMVEGGGRVKHTEQVVEVSKNYLHEVQSNQDNPKISV